MKIQRQHTDQIPASKLSPGSMRSLWTVSFVGSHTAVTIKKIERLLGIRATQIERERVLFDGQQLERAIFHVEHGDMGWSDLVVHLLEATSKIAHAWRVSGDVSSVVAVSVDPRAVGTALQATVPAGLKEISWQLRKDQSYPSARWSQSGSNDAWSPMA